jgi:hypothetical protein
MLHGISYTPLCRAADFQASAERFCNGGAHLSSKAPALTRSNRWRGSFGQVAKLGTSCAAVVLTKSDMLASPSGSREKRTGWPFCSSSRQPRLLRPLSQLQGDDQPLHRAHYPGFPLALEPNAIELHPILDFACFSG